MTLFGLRRHDQTFKTGLYWFTNDLRIEDNQALFCATEKVRQLLCIYTVDPSWFKPNRYGQKPVGKHRWRFLYETLIDLSNVLKIVGQQLLIIYEHPLDALAKLISQYNIDAIFRSQNAGFYENQYWRRLCRRYRMLHFEEVATHTIFTESSLPFALTSLPPTFSAFKKRVETMQSGLLKNEQLLTCIKQFPPPPNGLNPITPKLPPVDSNKKLTQFTGGASEGNKHLSHYFDKRLPSSYKQVRNALDGWENSTKLSPWLANGSISVRKIIGALQDYEANIEANESTYWIRFELLWREYFQWFAHAYQAKLFSHRGIKSCKILSCFYPERFQRWCQGNTPFPLVNACMKQLNNTGFMSNRGRQIAASCFVNELNLDWRYGAAYFEQQLIDYDVGPNWGNWQYLAGVGADPRGKRRFDIDKQTATYDPDKSFIAKWEGEVCDKTLDSVDAADWPVVNTESSKNRP